MKELHTARQEQEGVSLFYLLLALVSRAAEVEAMVPVIPGGNRLDGVTKVSSMRSLQG